MSEVETLRRENAQMRRLLKALCIPFKGLQVIRDGDERFLTRTCPHCHVELDVGLWHEHAPDCVVMEARRWIAPCRECKGVGDIGDVVCPTCRGTGTTPLPELKRCGYCGGMGQVDSGAPDPQGNFIEVRCPECDGTGLESVRRLNMRTGDEVRQSLMGDWQIAKPEHMDVEEFVQFATREISNRAHAAAMNFDPADIVVSHDQKTYTVFLRRTCEAVYDDEGEFLKWEYKPLLWAEFRAPRAQFTGNKFDVVHYSPRIVMLCPWLVMRRLPDGTIQDGKIVEFVF